MKHSNFLQKNFFAVAIAPQSVGNAGSVNGNAIDCNRIGRQITVVMLGGAFGTGVTATCILQGQKKSDDAWEALLDKTGATLAFTPALLADAGLLENGVIYGTVLITAAQAEAYKQIRIVYTRGAEAQTALIAAFYVIDDLYEEPNPVAALLPDALLNKQVAYA